MKAASVGVCIAVGWVVLALCIVFVHHYLRSRWSK